MSTLDRLESLHDAATPAPWSASFVAETGEIYDIAGGPRVNGWLSAPVYTRHPEQDHSLSAADGSLTCAMRNALPALIGVARAAQRLLDDGSCETWPATAGLAVALDTLEQGGPA